MSFLFKRIPKTPAEFVRVLEELLIKLDSSGDPKKALEDVNRYLRQLKLVISGEDTSSPLELAHLLANELCHLECLYYMVLGLRKMDFDLRKDVVSVFSALLKKPNGNGLEKPVVQALLLQPETLVLLMRGPEHEELALSCGKILRECILNEQLHAYVLYLPYFWSYFEYPQRQQFETIAETVQTLEALLTRNPRLVGQFLVSNREHFLVRINSLVQSDNYVLKRRSARLLCDILLQKSCQAFLFEYTDDPTSLKIVMMLLSDKLRNVNLEGFQLLRLFFAKPKKTQKIFDIFVKNKENFLRFFDNFDISDLGGSIYEERDFIVNEIRKLPNIERVEMATQSN
ncbi:hypothetical protein PUMCH_002728 [Australozyma saopauloensis]|uniref:Mo25-like protein n=1 Tax=Australozyma saopauloensis TaxID=291208 RepID=A0AAX4HA27_9ASCO|nr:hypothetical protein PUMCH_002728 [[Candida] saopauloensis]